MSGHLLFRMRPFRCGAVTRRKGHKRIALTDHPASVVRMDIRSRVNGLLHGRLPASKSAQGSPVRTMTVEQMLTVCAPYDVISFDIFDTLLCRAVLEPADIFRTLQMHRGQIDFAAARARAENAVRAEKSEPTISDIYCRLAQWGVVADADAAARAEIALEKALCRPVQPMPELIRRLMEAGKRVIAVSDMYLPSDVLQSMLTAAGYPAIHQVYVSCEMGCGKAGGQLMRLVKQKENTTNLLHIGDNMVGDVLGAIAADADAGYWVNRPKLCLGGNRAQTMTQSVHQALCAQRLSADVSDAYRVGYQVAGLMTLGFCRQVREWQDRYGWDQLLFAARDGYAMHRMYTKYFGQAVYLPISRAASQMLCAAGNIDAYVDNNLVARLGSGETMRHVLIGLGLESALPKWADLVSLDGPVTKPAIAALKKVMHRDPAILTACFAEAQADAWTYFSDLLKGCRNVAMVDTGWKGSSGMLLGNYLRGRGMDISVTNALLGTGRGDAVRNQADAGRLVSYLYGPGHHRSILQRQFRKGTIPCTIMEMLYAADLPHLISYRRNGDDFTYGQADHAFAQRAAEQQQGMMDFAEDFMAAEKALGITLPITADDAYAPFDLLTQDIDLLLRLYGDHLHGAAPTEQGQSDTFAAMLSGQRWISRHRYNAWRKEHQ